jgi:hypothetical protein
MVRFTLFKPAVGTVLLEQGGAFNFSNVASAPGVQALSLWKNSSQTVRRPRPASAGPKPQPPRASSKPGRRR